MYKKFIYFFTLIRKCMIMRTVLLIIKKYISLLFRKKTRRPKTREELLREFIEDLSNPMTIFAPITVESVKYLPPEYARVAYPQCFSHEDEEKPPLKCEMKKEES